MANEKAENAKGVGTTEKEPAALSGGPGKEVQAPKGPGCLRWALILILVVVIAAALLSSLRKVDADQVGLRVIKEGMGIWKEGPDAAKILKPGWHPVVPWFHEFIRYDKTLQKFEITSKAGGIRSADYPLIEIRTSDGYRVKLDATIIFHVIEDQASHVRKNYRSNLEIKELGIKVVCPGILQNKMSEILQAQDFYDSGLRDEKTEEAKKAMNEFFHPRGIEIVDVVLRDFEFPERYEEAILRKVLAEQLRQVQEALAKAADTEATWKKIIAEGDRDAEAERARGTARAQEIDAEADRILTIKKAEGNLLISQSEAKGRRLINQALSGKGGDVYVGLEYAKALQGLEVIMIPSSGEGAVNPLDADRLMRMMEVK
jgi:regulator of protease activity HflC (stomatin/prohibitin superfamily)